jgi:hypothetical protein
MPTHRKGQPNPRKHRLTCNLNDEEKTRFANLKTQAGHHSDSAYLRDQALRANPTRTQDKDWQRAFLQRHVELAGVIDHWEDRDAALALSKELIGRIVR